jgi:Carboxypeptidase regulatory-like domain
MVVFKKQNKADHRQRRILEALMKVTHPLFGGALLSRVFQQNTVAASLRWLCAGTRKCRILRLVLVLSISTSYGAALNAQATSGTILGTIQDPGGSAIPDATVTVTNIATSQSKLTHTDSGGNYSVLYLIPGQYEVSVEKTGFDAVKRTAFPLDVDQKIRVNFTMTIGSVQQTVTVTSPIPLLNTDSSEQGQLVDSRQITSLPLNVRNFAQLLNLTTGTSPNYSAQGGSVSSDHPEGLSATNVNGLPSDGNNWQLDGVSNNEAFFNVLSVNPSIDAIQEFKSITSNYSAEFGRAGGAVVQISIKSGTNSFHGVAFEFLRNNDLEANNYFSKRSGSPIPPYRQNQFGGNIGGPIRKDRTFFFVDYEGFRSALGQTEIMSIPDALQRQGIFTETDPITGAAQPTIYNPLTRQPYPNNTVTNINPTAAAIMNLLPLPNLTGPNGAALLANNYFGSETQTHNVDQGDLRIDHRISDKNQAFVRYSNLDTTFSSPPYLGKLVGGDPGLSAISHSLNQNAVISDVHTFSPTLLNEFRFGLDSVQLNWKSFDANTTTDDEVGIPGLNGTCSGCGGLSQIAISGVNTFGHTNFSPTQRHTTVFQWIDDVTMIRGKHTIKVGGDVSYIRASLFQAQRPIGLFSFNQNMTSNGVGSGGIGLASFLTGYEASATRTVLTGFPAYRTNQLFLFVQDDVRATEKLTLNLGLRYEIYTAPTINHNNQANFDLPTGNLLAACIATSCTGGVNTDYGNIEPRVGFAYSPDLRTVVRSAFGISVFTPGSGGQIGTLGLNEPYLQGQTIQPNTIYTPGSTINQSFPALPALQPRPGAGPGVDIPTGSSIYYVPSNNRMTKAYQWNLDIERQIVPNLLLDIAYIGNAVTGVYINLPGNVPPLGVNARLPIQQRYPYYAVDPNLQGITERINGGHSDYHSLQAKLDKHFSHGLSFLAAYTWSKNLQRGQDFVNPSQYMIKDVNSQDLRQRFVLSYTYQLPIGQGQRYGSNFNVWENAAAGGWQIQGITTLRTGLPYQVTLSSSQLDNGLANVPNRVGPGTLAHPTIAQWFNYNDFTQPGDQYGNAIGYFGLRGPGGVNWDMSMFKNFQFTEARYLQFRAEFFNVFNNVQFGNPNASIGQFGVGTITSLALGSNPREIQLALKLYF